MEQARQNVVGSTIRRLRTEKGLTQELLSARCGAAGYEIPRGTLAKIEAQIRGATDLELFVIATALRLEISALFPSNLGSLLKKGEFAKQALE
jgi:transcriptional regulator with XRE-family HTH domain